MQIKIRKLLAPGFLLSQYIYRYLSKIYNATSVNIPPATNAAMYPILFIIF
jgi:hypothetical protein